MRNPFGEKERRRRKTKRVKREKDYREGQKGDRKVEWERGGNRHIER